MGVYKTDGSFRGGEGIIGKGVRIFASAVIAFMVLEAAPLETWASTA